MWSRDGDVLGTVASTQPIILRITLAITLAVITLITQPITSQTTPVTIGVIRQAGGQVAY